MSRDWPALDIIDANDLVLAALDDFAPTAIEDLPSGARVFFATGEQRDAALAALIRSGQAAAALDVPDEDWAVRSQQNLTPIIVGRIRIVPHARFLIRDAPVHGAADPGPVEIVIEPSMGFGTGHHATTRLCLQALQNLDLSDAGALDVGTGSGILAIAAARLGASPVHGVDYDADAIQSATENLARNPDARHVTFEIGDLSAGGLPRASLVMANLTGAVLIRAADQLLNATTAGGTLVLSGILAAEEAAVSRAFLAATAHHLRREDEWVCLTMKKR